MYVMRGAFKYHHLLAEARRHLTYVLRGRPHPPGTDETIVQKIVDHYTRPVGRWMMTADLHALGTKDQAVLRPPAGDRSASPYERARLAATALTARILKADRGTEQTTDVATVEQTRRTFEAAAKMAARLQDGIRGRAPAYGPRTPPPR
ncbi:hypothetical protein [Streptomyces niveus]|uniref:hypothetical protein n=1 Tax=Streptomyces niveus TaxID=193462 RepID=UPI0036E527BE